MLKELAGMQKLGMQSWCSPVGIWDSLAAGDIVYIPWRVDTR